MMYNWHMITHKHPAKYSNELLPILYLSLVGYNKILDPFAGTGKLRQIRPDAYLVEIEPEWAAMGGAIVANTLYLPFGDGKFDAICTSPCYGNRMADSFTDHQPHKKYRRNTYTHSLGRKLHKDNSGHMQWGKKYRDFHTAAWKDCIRVLRPEGRFVLNISDHIRNKTVQPVSKWHVDTLTDLGLSQIMNIDIKTPRNRFGENHSARVEYEHIVIFEKE